MNYWNFVQKIMSKNYICGHCGNDINSNEGYYITSNGSTSNGAGYIYICHHCNKPTYFGIGEQIPGPIYGKKFDEEIFEDNLIYSLYNEAQKCMKVNAYTSVGMCCRKLLMHIAVNCGAEENKNFTEYVNYLDENNYVPTNCKNWVDIIRTKGNEANHEIVLLNKNDAEQLINFIQMIIAVVYEMPYQAKKYSGEE
ncbi:MAG: DUF4145 domain-containing protein [Bacilli bacterium]|nr:DUF4145 domain-containing protein [Bacilli bacterium]